MAWQGKAIGAAVGSAFGPIGAAVGAWLGHNFDHNLEAQDAAQQQDYLSRLSLFALGVTAACSDGRLHANERKRLLVFGREIFVNVLDAELDALIGRVSAQPLTLSESAQIFSAMGDEYKPTLACELLSILYADHEFDEREEKWLNELITLMDGNPRAWQEIAFFYERDSRLGKVARHQLLQILDLPDGADEATIKSSYRRQANEYHPDKLMNVSEGVRKLAEEKLRDLNAAYESLIRNGKPAWDHDSLAAQFGPGQWRGLPELNQSDVAQCPMCGQKNRLPMPQVMPKARCGMCYGLLLLPREVFQQATG